MSKITNPVVLLHWHKAPESACHIAITNGSTDFRDAEYRAVLGAGYTDEIMNSWSKTGYYMAAEIERLRQALAAAENNLIDSECHVAELISSKDRDNALIDTYDWHRQRLHEAAENVIKWCRQEAEHRTGNAENAESYACVRELRDALAFCESCRSSNAGATENDRSNEKAQVVQEQSKIAHIPGTVQNGIEVAANPVNGVTAGKPLTIELPDVSSKAFWSGAGKSETFHPESYKRWVKEAIERDCVIAGIVVEVK